MKNKINMSSISNKINFIYGDECEKNTVGMIIFSDGTDYFFDSEYKNKMSNEELEALLLRGAVIFKNGKYYKPASFNDENVSYGGAVVDPGDIEVDLSAYATKNYVDSEIDKIELTPGPQGEQGPKGEKGEQGPKGETGEQGPAGADGKTPVKGVDYFTADDKVEMLDGYATETFVNDAILNGQLGGGSNNISKFGENRYIPISITPDINSEQSVVYSTYFTSGASLNESFTTFYLSVLPGEKYTVSTTTLEDPSYAAVLFYDNDVYKGYDNKNPTAGSRVISDYTFVIPEGVNLIRISTFTWGNFKLVKEDLEVVTFEDFSHRLDELVFNTSNAKPSFSYNIYETGIQVIYKLDNVDFMVQLDETGGNGLFDFHKLGKINNSSEYPSTKFANVDIIKTSYTDWHSPFMVGAINNIDGDNKNNDEYNHHYTGGNHQYNNQGSGSTRTARLSSLHFYIDGIEKINNIGYGNRLEVKWTNFVQGYNTTKQDGSGREILKEDHILTFDGKDWKSHVELTALEDIHIICAYGFACDLSEIFNSNVRYIGGENRQIYNVNESSDCGNTKASKIIAEGSNYSTSIELDLTYGAGALNDNVDPAPAFCRGNKIYFSLMNRKVNEGEHYYYRGVFKFDIL